MDEKAYRTSKRRVLTAFITVLALLALVALPAVRFAYGHSFSPRKWRSRPERRAEMAADLLQDYGPVGMSKAQTEALLGPDDSARGYFNRPGRSVYWLGERRTVIDSEWLLIGFENGVVTAYEIATD